MKTNHRLFLYCNFLLPKKEWLLAIVVMLISTYTLSAQETIVKGIVSSAKDAMPVPGVNVLIKGTNTVVVTDFDGNYSIKISPKDVLVFSFIGYSNQEVTVGNKSQLNITLKEDLTTLEEVVVVGYGTQKRSKISGSVSEVSQKAIARNPSANLSNSLVGQATGIIATQRSGEPGKDASNIYIRGIGTIGDSSPIYVIDGIVRSSSDFAQLNPSEIQSFSILKDAASAAVFGIRAGNGSL